MRKVLLIDYSRNFIGDIQRNLLINERDDIEITTLETIDQVDNIVYSQKFDIIVIYAGLVESREWKYDIPVRSYARKMSDIEISKKYNIRCYGIIKRSSELIEYIIKDNLSLTSSFKDTERPTNVLTAEDMPDNLKNWTETGEKTVKKEKKTNVPSYQVENKLNDRFIDVAANDQNTSSNQQSEINKSNQSQESQNTVVRPLYNEYTGERIIYDDEVEEQTVTQNNNQNQQYESYHKQTPQVQQASTVQNQLVPVQKQYSYYPSFQGQKPAGTDYYGNYVYEMIQINPISSNNINIPQEQIVADIPSEKKENELSEIKDFTKETTLESSVKNLKYKATDRFKKYEQEEIARAKEEAVDKFEKDMGNIKKDAQCITVYSAKGGVGKTTISCELSSFLALTSHGRGKYKVCIVDFNIDFGDVMTTLEFDQHGANMTTWAGDIKNRIARGEKPEDINYTRSEMEIWLQKKEESGLYALLAPTNNVDSMDIGEDEMRVMVDNLCKNGDFDFVICDTGNNTRDSSFIALEKADIVMMVVTQDVQTANCNNSFLQTAERIGFDMNKIKLVINMVRPAKIVGIAPEELETAFVSKKTLRPYRFETLAKIKHSNEVVRCGNKGEPLIYNSNHEFTRSIGEIVKKITGQERVLAAPQKESLFDRIFKKK